ncbi:MAG: cyclic nucleotide-binding domain-containing protein [Candidatus Omnitrophica bacterium]|nr:cyclic nucleotide-binding domain-containing protein [Candidatus Omnitrophota bacterium]
MKDLEAILKEHPFFKGLDQKHLEFIAGCGNNVAFKDGDIILKEGQDADKFYIIRQGKVAIFIAHPSSITIQTIKEGDILGWSWLIPPHKYRFSARALEDTRAVALDGKCLKAKCEENHELGYNLLKSLVDVLAGRLEATRIQLLDIYNK